MNVWLVVAALAALMVVAPAAAEVNGNCDVVVQGQNARDLSSDDRRDAFRVATGDDINYTITVDRPAKTFRMIASLGPYEVVLDEQNFTLGQQVLRISGNTTFEGLSAGASGLYRYRGEVEMWDGTKCTGSMLVHILPEQPLTPVMAGAIAVAGGGLTLIILAIIRGYQDSKEIWDVVRDYAGESKRLIKK